MLEKLGIVRFHYLVKYRIQRRHLKRSSVWLIRKYKHVVYCRKKFTTKKKKPQVCTTLKSIEPNTNDGARKCFLKIRRYIVSSFKNDTLFDKACAHLQALFTVQLNILFSKLKTNQ